MGHNIDLINLLGLPEKVKCSNCNNLIQSGFEEYDIDCGESEASKNNGYLILDVFCNICNQTNKVKVISKIKK